MKEVKKKTKDVPLSRAVNFYTSDAKTLSHKREQKHRKYV